MSGSRAAVFGLGLFLSACTGAGEFLDHGMAWSGRNPNIPAGESDTLRRVRGQAAAAGEPLLPEPGNIWLEPPQAPGPRRTDRNASAQKGPAVASPTIRPERARATAPQRHLGHAGEKARHPGAGSGRRGHGHRSGRHRA